MNKIEVTINVDEKLWTMAKDNLPISRNDFIDLMLRMYMMEDTRESKLLKKAVKLQNDLNKVMNSLDRLHKNHKQNKNNQELYDKAMETVNRINYVQGYVGKNQLDKISQRVELNPSDLYFYVEKHGIELRNYGELPKTR